MKLTAITGGIGAGKSVVSHILAAMGYKVFDCDSQAKSIMDNDREIKAKLKCEIHPEAVDDKGRINRAKISGIVFSDAEKLNTLNKIVHTAVVNAVKDWSSNETNKDDHLFVETAILYQSGLDKIVDDVLEVVAPDEVRIKRVMKRNALSRQDVIARIKSQTFTPQNRHKVEHDIINDGHTALLPQILDYLTH